MTESEREILNKLGTLEETMKMLLVNDVLKDAENLMGQGKSPAPQGESQKIEELCKLIEEKDNKIADLKYQIESHKSRIKTLQLLSDKKDKTIQAKDERIQILQKTVQDFNQQKNIIELDEKRKQCIGKYCHFPHCTETFHKDNKGRFIPNSYIPKNANNRTYKIIEYSDGMFYIFSKGKTADFDFWVPVDAFDIEKLLKG